MKSPVQPGVLAALGAAAAFGVSTPLAKLLLADFPPLLLAGLLYLGSGVGLGVWRYARRRAQPAAETPLHGVDFAWLAAAIAVGGIAGPVVLMWGLSHTPASTAALLMNLEGVFTALLAWGVFHENVDRRIAVGMLAIVVGGAVLSWSGRPAVGLPWGSLAIVAACAAWALDNNLTRKIAGADPVQIGMVKGLIAGAVNVAAAVALGVAWPASGRVAAAALLGVASYGLSLVLFIVALRHLGSTRASAYFSTAPFVGAALSFALLGETASVPFFVAAALIGAGLWLYLTERHQHLHTHPPVVHDHWHTHDAHHQHAHPAGMVVPEAHAHEHEHPALEHTHPHFPDLHHRHTH